MSIVEWIIIGLIPGFLAGALAAHNRQTVRAGSGNSKPLPMSPVDTLHAGEYGGGYDKKK